MLDLRSPTTVVMFTGPQGSGKTSAATLFRDALFNAGALPLDMAEPHNAWKWNGHRYVIHEKQTL